MAGLAVITICPAHSLPVPVAAPEVVRRGDGIADAIPSLQVYTTGAELNIVYRMARTAELSRQPGEALMRLTVNGRKLIPLGGEYRDESTRAALETVFGARPEQDRNRDGTR